MMTTKKKRMSQRTRTMKRGSLLDGWRKTSPIPPPFLRPWFIVVTRHMKSVSQLRSFSDSSSSTTAVAEQESEEEEDDVLEEVRGCVSIRKSSESRRFQYFVILADDPFFLPWKKMNPKMEKKQTRMRARMKVKMMERRLPVTALITFWSVSSRKIISTS